MNKMKKDSGFWEDFNSTISHYRETISKISNENLSKHPKLLTSDSGCSLPSTAQSINKQQLQERRQFEITPLEIDKIGDNDDELLLTTNALTNMTISKNLSNSRCGFDTNVSDQEFVKKFRIYVEKSLELLHEIRSFLTKGVIEPDGDDDYKRRMKRVQEFSTRFSRYYLYQLNQLTNELTFSKKLIPTTINCKLLSCHRIIVQSLQAYLSHLPTSIGDCACDKFKLLLNEIVYVSQLYGVLKKIKIYENTDIYIDALKKSVVSVTEELKGMKKIKIIRKKPIKNVIEIDPNRFSMYKRITPETSTEEKFKKVKSRYRTATFKHRPPVEKQSSVLPLSKRNFPFQRYTSRALRDMPIPTPNIEDEIETMVQYDNERALTLYHEDVADKNLAVLHNSKNNESIIDDKDEIINADLTDLCEDSQKSTKAIEEKILENPCKQFKFIVNFDDNEETPFEIPKNTSKGSVVTVSGVNIPKRICIRIRDDNFDIDNDNNLRMKHRVMISSGTQVDINSEKEPKNETKIIEIRKISKSLEY